jgi:hypothetical protein
VAGDEVERFAAEVPVGLKPAPPSLGNAPADPAVLHFGLEHREHRVAEDQPAYQVTGQRTDPPVRLRPGRRHFHRRDPSHQ